MYMHEHAPDGSRLVGRSLPVKLSVHPEWQHIRLARACSYIYIYMAGSQAWPVFFHAVANDRFEYTSLDEQVDNYIDFIWIVVNDIRAQFNTLDTVVMLYLLRKLN